MFNQNQKRLNKIVKITNVQAEKQVNTRFDEIKNMKKLDANVVQHYFHHRICVEFSFPPPIFLSV